ncbi:hypothetical protein ELQ35_04435 [Peribacillus cavernae]|uniref:Uncharacterized protein n=1 Tax=Peribacillus cavernae TaxID=1674310 RepID=A0A433HTF4_9BACI|nr:hypothetical protein [Peribacillus cavernae]MDQ0218615.1 hypothetical protein [Peribacillus cavernae]RUQ31599.1 hypothetical protein ELQ35_04435 [Peribacillus cavernae]
MFHIGHPAIDLSLIYSFLPVKGRGIFFEHYGNVDDETKSIALFKSIYSSIVLLVYGIDKQDAALVDAARASLRLAFKTE